MRILIIIDKGGTAIDRLAQSVAKYLPQHEIKVFPVHPKRNDIETMIEVQKLMTWCDVLDIHYWKSGKILRTSFPNEFDSKPKVLFHFNPYDAESEENKKYDKVVVGNKEIHSRVPSAYYIPYGVDLSYFKFKPEYTDEKVVNMSVARIEGKKGILPVAKACKELGYKFRLVGRVSKPNYMREIMEAGEGVIEFWENATDDKLREVYYSSAIHVCNSVDGFESGTLPVLEAMACGLPVLARNIGHVPDLYNGSNLVLRDNAVDHESLKNLLKDMMENREWRLKLRQKAWETVKTRDVRKMVQEINKLYNSLYLSHLPLVSIILPTKNNPECFVKSLYGALKQDYPKLEILVSDSSTTPIKLIIDEAQKRTSIPIRYLYFPHKNNYTLAEARNRAVVEADGEYLVFCDNRIKMNTDAVSHFVNYRKAKCWLWGMKDNAIKSFVENFSFISRREFIDKGMFCERMQWYGGMTQEVRERFEKQNGFNFIFIDEAKAEGIKRSKSKTSRMEAIVEAKYLLYKMYYK